MVILACGAVEVTLMYLLTPLNANPRYEAGVKLAGADTAAGTFSHRPLAYRLVTDVVFRTADLLSVGPVTFELAVRVLLALLVLGAAALLQQGLRQQHARCPGWHAVVVGGALILLGGTSAGEPDWLAVVFTVAGTGLALLGDGRRPWLYATLAGAAFVAAAGMKIVTLPVAVIGLAVVWAVHRHLAVRALVATIGVGVLDVVATVLWVPWEIQWLLDIRTVQNSAADGLVDAPAYALGLVADRPVLALLPAVVVLARGRERVLVAGAVVAAAGLVVAQGQYFDYHAIQLVVVAAVAAFRALRDRVSPLVGAAVLVVVVAASGLTAVGSSWTVNHERLWVGGLAGFALAAVVWAVAVRGRPTRRHGARGAGGPAAAVVALALLLPGATPWSTQLLRTANPDGSRPSNVLQIRADRRDTAARVHRVIGGPDVAVTYLTSGEWTYWLQNPTSCRYPSPLFLQRTRKPARLATASYRENVGCLTAPDARWLVVETSWFITSRQPADVRALILRQWDCAGGTTVSGLRLCPRR